MMVHAAGSPLQRKTGRYEKEFLFTAGRRMVIKCQREDGRFPDFRWLSWFIDCSAARKELCLGFRLPSSVLSLSNAARSRYDPRICLSRRIRLSCGVDIFLVRSQLPRE